jgi:hypothetical protein
MHGGNLISGDDNGHNDFAETVGGGNDAIGVRWKRDPRGARGETTVIVLDGSQKFAII